MGTLPLWAFLLLLLHTQGALGCTVIVVGRKASADGSVILAHTDDAGGGASDLRLIRVPPMDHPRGSWRPVYATNKGYPRIVSHHRGPMYEPSKGEKAFAPLGHVPQVRHTYGYYEQNYGLVNEVGLAIAESSVSSRTVGWSKNFHYGYNLFDINELSKIALERCETARCAIRTMGALAEEYGFYSNYSRRPRNPNYADSAEVLALADRDGEAWVFQVMTGAGNRSAIWVAQRVPDDHVAVVANALTTRRIDLKDKNHFMASKNVKQVARDNGWWSPSQGPFDFTAAYMFGAPTPLVPLYVGRRMWRIYDLVAPSLQLDPTLGYLAIPGRPTYPFSVKPEHKVSVREVMRILRDHYEGTPFDLTKGIAAGPFGNPVRYSVGTPALRAHMFGGWERSVSMYRAIYSMVISIRPNVPVPMAAIMWYGQDAPHGTVYVPFYGGQSNVPASYLEGLQSQFSLKSAYWAFNLVNLWSYNQYTLIHREVEAMQQRLEGEAFALQAELDASIKTHCRSSLMQHVERRQEAFAEKVVAEWWAFAWRLVETYNNGYVIRGEGFYDMFSWGYPWWWMKAVGYDQWPGDTFEYPTNMSAALSTSTKFTMSSSMTARLHLDRAGEMTEEAHGETTHATVDMQSESGESESPWEGVAHQIWLVTIGAVGAVLMVKVSNRRQGA